MPYNGTFVEARETQFGHRIIVENERGDWHLFGKGRMPTIAKGTPVSFEAQKSQNGNTWNYGNLRPDTDKPRDKTPEESAQIGGFRPNPDEQIFITGIVGRAMGSGQFSVTDIKALTLAAYEAWQALQQAKKHPEQPKLDRRWGTAESNWKFQHGVEQNPPDDDIPF